jgi:hypothetical protein
MRSSTIPFEFCPGLFDVLKATTAPGVEYFKTLPADNIRGNWGVYLLVLEKDGHRPRIYIGSSTNAKFGLHQRFLAYEKNWSSPKYVAESYDEGYTLVNKSLLCWTPVPHEYLEPTIRLLVLAFEGTFAYIFWAMKAVLSDYGMSHICPWEYIKLPYDGLCSHCCLYESIRGEFGLSTEEFEVWSAKRKERQKAYEAGNKSEYHYRQMSFNRDEYLDAAAARDRKWRAENIEHARKLGRDRQRENKIKGTYSCEKCNITCPDSGELKYTS